MDPEEVALSEEDTTPVEYQLPEAAEIIEERSSPSDFFGDYSYAASFRLPSSEINNLTEKGFDWVTTDGRQLSMEGTQWEVGILPEEILRQIRADYIRLNDAPDDNVVYKYLYRYVEGGQWRLFVIDVEQGKVYYYRSSW
jgi:hypothetical protein